VKAIEDAVLSASPEPLEDDATLIVLAPVDSPEALTRAGHTGRG
jgi:hypothetical protein